MCVIQLLRSGDRRIIVLRPAWTKVSEILSQKPGRRVEARYTSSYSRGGGRRIREVGGSRVRSYLKNKLKNKITEAMAHTIK
jgi:hypothetical protein